MSIADLKVNNLCFGEYNADEQEFCESNQLCWFNYRPDKVTDEDVNGLKYTPNAIKTLKKFIKQKIKTEDLFVCRNYHGNEGEKVPNEQSICGNVISISKGRCLVHFKDENFFNQFKFISNTFELDTQKYASISFGGNVDMIEELHYMILKSLECFIEM